MSPRAVHRPAYLSRQSPREGEVSAGRCRRIWLVGKQSKHSNRRILAATSSPTDWSPGFGLFYRATPVPCLPRQGGCLVRLRSADLTASAMLRLLSSNKYTTAGRFSRNLFGLHELPSSIRRRGLTRGGPERYITIGGLTKSPNGPVAGLSPEIAESAV